MITVFSSVIEHCWQWLCFLLPFAAKNFKQFSSDRCSHLRLGYRSEKRALSFLKKQRLRFLKSRYSCRFGEIDLIMQERRGDIVFVEVRARKDQAFGGAASSIQRCKQKRLFKAAMCYLQKYCHFHLAYRFDVIAFENGEIFWYKNAFCTQFT